LNKSWYSHCQQVRFCLIYSNEHAFAALKADGSITTWGDTSHGGANAPNAPTDKGYIKIYSTLNPKSFWALE
jgi:hypothetical protein